VLASHLVRHYRRCLQGLVPARHPGLDWLQAAARLGRKKVPVAILWMATISRTDAEGHAERYLRLAGCAEGRLL